MSFAPLSRPRTKIIKSIDILTAERSKALACLERALFYAEEMPARLNAVYVHPKSKNQYSRNITAIYGLAGLSLRKRRDTVTETYSRLLETLKGEAVPYREKEIVVKSATHVFGKLGLLARQAWTKDASSALEELCNDWKGMDNICRLFMDEITHLSDCAQSLNGTIKTLAAIKKSEDLINEAKKSLIWAVAGILITILFAAYGIRVAKDAAKDASAEKTQGQILDVVNQIKNNTLPDPKLDEQLQKLQSRLNDISTNIVQMPGKIDALKEPLKDIKVELDQRAYPPIIINNNASIPASTSKQNGIINVETSH